MIGFPGICCAGQGCLGYEGFRRTHSQSCRRRPRRRKLDTGSAFATIGREASDFAHIRDLSTRRRYVSLLKAYGSLLSVVGLSVVLAEPSPTHNGTPPTPTSAQRVQSIPETRSGTITTPQPTKLIATASVDSNFAFFLFASGFGLFLALLAWGDQIRGMTRETRELERDFLQKHKLTREQFKRALGASSPTERLHGLAEIMHSGKLKTVSEIEALGDFEEWLSLSDGLRRLHSQKYWLALALAVSLFLAGGLSTFLGTTSIGGVMTLVIVPLLLLAYLLVLVVRIGHSDAKFSRILKTLSELG